MSLTDYISMRIFAPEMSENVKDGASAVEALGKKQNLGLSSPRYLKTPLSPHSTLLPLSLYIV
jgi:hypothetical protein